MATGLRDKRLSDLRTENKKNEETIKSANEFLDDYKKSGLVYRIGAFMLKESAKAVKADAEKSLQKNNEEIKVLEKTEIKL